MSSLAYARLEIVRIGASSQDGATLNLFQDGTNPFPSSLAMTEVRMGKLSSEIFPEAAKRLNSEPSSCLHHCTPFGDELLLRALGFARAILLCWVLGRCVLPTASKPSALGRGRGVGNQGMVEADQYCRW
ncbi:hypothetical protein NE237_032844 [Protea cynaroides]|uniref:Uncharacterized protein n=1 Tax=Protea cynaroides TaxID=273540 RepID=A0A9Q0L438_9MAGN|nr:hypothetical protein NE237_032844 [Protea cynaroides]